MEVSGRLQQGGSLSAVVHPLVLVNVSDHFTRLRADFESKTAGPSTGFRAFGVLLGSQEGREVEICHSFELKSGAADQTIDAEFFKDRLAQFATIFPKYDLVGWYATGSEPTEGDCVIHKDIISKYNESPLMLLMDPSKISGDASSSGDPPIASNSDEINGIGVYEGEVQWTTGAPKMTLTRVGQTFATEDSERIAVDHVTRVVHKSSSGNAGTGAVGQHISNSTSALQTLADRVELVADFVDATIEGKVPFDHALLRDINAICLRLPATEEESPPTDNPEWLTATQVESTCVAHLAGMTKTVSQLQEVIEKFNFAFENGPGMGPATASYDLPAISGPLMQPGSAPRSGRRQKAFRGFRHG